MLVLGPVCAAPAVAQAIPNKVAQFSGLDKITGRIISFDVYINETVQFGALQVTPRVCYNRPLTETPKTDAFVEVDEITLDNKVRRIFTGWMFADSPGLHAVEHPIYDVWLTRCKMTSEVPDPTNPQGTNQTQPATGEDLDATDPNARSGDLPAADGLDGGATDAPDGGTGIAHQPPRPKPAF